ncbi:MAG: hypothetical protein ACOVP5_00545, partial [Chitinophagales bacterium]
MGFGKHKLDFEINNFPHFVTFFRNSNLTTKYLNDSDVKTTILGILCLTLLFGSCRLTMNEGYGPIIT